GADLSRADLTGAYLAGARLDLADLRAADLSAIDLSTTSLKRCRGRRDHTLAGAVRSPSRRCHETARRSSAPPTHHLRVQRTDAGQSETASIDKRDRTG